MRVSIFWGVVLGKLVIGARSDRGLGLPRRALRILTTITVAVLVQFVAASHAFADHETRDDVIRDSGLDLVLVGLVIGAAVLVIAAFAVAMLLWERRDDPHGDAPAAHDHNE